VVSPIEVTRPMWNTMPAHAHDRRTECYLYFDVPDDARGIHLLGQPTETRHLVIGDRQAVISPFWPVHSGVGTRRLFVRLGHGRGEPVLRRRAPRPGHRSALIPSGSVDVARGASCGAARTSTPQTGG
jgi:hypothetical protein